MRVQACACGFLLATALTVIGNNQLALAAFPALALG